MVLKACGIIAEYNPFHLGHQYQIQKVKEKYPQHCIIALMSGNWLQRGEPAILDKWQRSEIALKNGCDLVVELPPHYAIQSADFFAKGSITLLKALQIDVLAFGTDVSSKFSYKSFGEKLVFHESAIKDALKELKHSGLSFPQQMAKVYEKLGLKGEFNQNTPNHLLALSYAKEVARIAPEITLFPILRKGQGYKENSLTTSFASGTSIRKQALLKNWEFVSDQVPKETVNFFKNSKLSTWKDYFPYLKYQLLLQKPDTLTQIYEVKEGLEYALKKETGENYEDFLENLKTKRYSYPRLQRLFSYLLFQITKEEMAQQQDYLRILGFNELGQRYLKEIKKEVSLPLITKVAEKNHQLLALNHRVDSIYSLPIGKKEQISGKIPLILKKDLQL